MPPPRYVVLLPVAGSVLMFAGFPGLLTKSRSQFRGMSCALAVIAKANEDTAARNHLAALTVWEEALWMASWTALWPVRAELAQSIHLSQLPSHHSRSGCSSCWGPTGSRLPRAGDSVRSSRRRYRSRSDS